MNDTDTDGLKDIIARAKNGDRDAFSHLYTAYFAPLYRYVFFRIGDKAEAEDILQDVFLKAYSSFGSYSYSGTSPLAYFYTIARNAVIDFRRKKKFPVAGEDDALTVPDDADTPEETSAKNESAAEIRRCIGKLPEEQQDVVILRFIDGQSTREIAALLGKSEEAVRQLQSRGLKSLRSIIKHHE